MSFTYTSSASNSGILLSALMNMRRDMNKAQTEISTGRLEDAGLTLGSKVGQSIQLRQTQAQMDGLVQSNAGVSTRLETSQAGLNSLLTLADQLQKALLAAPDGDPGHSTLKTAAANGLSTFQATLNQTVNGDAVFGGEAVNTTPIANYFSALASSAKTANNAAFVSAFGFSQDSPSVSGITAAQMQGFIDNGLSAQFQPAAWQANWSSASSKAVQSRISPTETVVTSVSANAAPIRQFAKVLTMVADLGIGQMSDAAYQTLKTSATQMLGVARAGLVQMQSDLGATQTRVTDATSAMKATSG